MTKRNGSERHERWWHERKRQRDVKVEGNKTRDRKTNIWIQHGWKGQPKMMASIMTPEKEICMTKEEMNQKGEQVNDWGQSVLKSGEDDRTENWICMDYSIFPYYYTLLNQYDQL